jgi:DNA invertase Pin-like site-specific DNA recombinase
MKVGIYARVSTHDQQTLRLQLVAMRKYAKSRKWVVTLEIKDIGSGASERPKRDELLQAARRREIDSILVWKLDRWGRSSPDLVLTLRELNELGVAFVSITEALDLSTPSGRAMVGLLSVFAEFERDLLRERVKAGIAQAKLEGRTGGRPKSAALQAAGAQRLFKKGMSKSEIARRLQIGRTSVIASVGESPDPSFTRGSNLVERIVIPRSCMLLSPT